MASISNDKNGRKRIQFTGIDGRRKTLRLGLCDKQTAEGIKLKVQHLLTARIMGISVERDVAAWVAQRDDDFHAKMAAVGLVDPRESQLPNEQRVLGAFIDHYIASRNATKKPLTQLFHKYTRNALCQFMGEQRPLSSINSGHAEEWFNWMRKNGIGENLARRRIGVARQFFNAAIRRKILTENPFMGINATVGASVDKFHYITLQDAHKIIAHCPDTQWKLIFALSRWGGLRCPSEHLSLEWEHVDLKNNRITVISPKTEYREGKGRRVIPLFPELRPFLEQARREAKPEDKFVITRYRKTGCNLRTQLIRIIRSAGLKPWPKLFNNLRSTRETELSERYPMHVVCRWMGNSDLIASKHYLQMKEEHFEKAVNAGNAIPQEATQIPTQQTGEIGGNREQTNFARIDGIDKNFNVYRELLPYSLICMPEYHQPDARDRT